MPFVAVTHGDDPYANARRVLEQLDLPFLQNKRVLIKPNAGRKVPPGKGITTAPQVVAAACDFFCELGADVSVGESTILGVTPLECLESTGIAAVVKDRSIPLLDLDVPPPKEMPVPDGVVLESLAICGEVPEFDYVVSVPVMKTHMHCGVSLSLKNMKGCLRGREKVRLHQLPQPTEPTGEKTLDLAIADLSGVLRPDVALIDGTVGMEGLGPSAGRPKPTGVMIASTNYLAADATAAVIMGFDPEEIPHLRLAARRAGQSIAVDSMDVSPASWREWVQPFERPPHEISLQFPDIEVLDSESCSACVSTLMLFLNRYYDKLADYLPLSIAIGKGHDGLPDGTLCVGNCAINAGGENIIVKGCPPVASDILRSLDG